MKRWLHHRSFQTRIGSLVVAAVGVAVALAAVASYFAVSHQLYRQVDATLSNDVQQIGTYNAEAALRLLDRGGALAQVVDKQGTVMIAVNQGAGIRPTAQQLDVIGQPLGSSVYSTLTTDGTDYRVLTTSINFSTSPGSQVPAGLQIAQPLTPVEKTLASLRLILVTVMIGGLAIAVILGLGVARAALRPVRRLTATAEHVAATQQLDAVVPAEADDELGRLAHAFNRMLAALGASRRQQAQLVSDAGHELRTPLTSLRTNVELLSKARTLPERDREELMADITAQVGELTTLVGDLVELARQDEQQPEPTEVRLDLILERAVERAARRAPSVRIEVDADRGSVRGQPALLERALLNVLDNATKWSPPGGTVRVVLRRGDRWVLEVGDEGPGIAEEDLAKVFDRFYRAPSARSMPGSGLGLAIVSQVVSAHGGAVEARRRPDGGTLIHLELPTVAEQEQDAPVDPPTPATWDQAAPAPASEPEVSAPAG